MPPQILTWPPRFLGGVAMALVLAIVGGCGVPLAWDSREELIEVAPKGLELVALKTHNGKIRVRGVDDASANIEITAKIEGGASSPAEVQACLDAIEIVVTETSDNTLEVSWDWKNEKRSSWSSKVSFDALIPSQLDVAAESQNGEIDFNGVDGACKMKTQNGRIRALGGSTSMTVETQNGELFIQTAAPEVRLSSHNGAIDAVLKSSEPLNGKVETHNGAIVLAVNPWASTRVTASTQNGAIHSQLPLDNQEVGKKSISGLLGDGDGELSVSTHNGAISLRAADAPAPQPKAVAEQEKPDADTGEVKSAEKDVDDPEEGAAVEETAETGEEAPEAP